VKAITYRRYGSPDVLCCEEIETPRPGPRDIVVQVRASSLNAADLEYLRGTPFIARMGSGLVRPRRTILSFDVAGTVVEIGSGVTRFAPGDAVFADLFDHGFGAFAEYACAPETAFAPMPTSLSFEQAASLPHSGILAIQGLLRGERIEPGSHVLINGAGGCVGPFAIQMAVAYGAEVTAVDRGGKLEFLRSLGADHVIDFEREDYTRTGRTYDWILDLAAHRPLRESRRALSDAGRYVMAGGPIGRFFRLLVAGPLLTRGTDRKMGMLMWKPFAPDDVVALTELVKSGAVTPRIDRVVPLEEVPEALRVLEIGEARGKIVVAVPRGAPTDTDRT
jgi:NADPH:quinone reductase-like Zn-dependent oxidoreductase